MKETGLMFKAPLVRDILSGQKTQTRRIAKLPHMNPLGEWEPTTVGGPGGGRTSAGKEIPLQTAIGHTRTGDVICAPFQSGDRIYVRETYWAWGRWETRYSEAKGRDEWHFVDMTAECGNPYLYAADGISQGRVKRNGGVVPTYWRRPAILMPKTAARIWLEVTGVRAERLQDISEADAQTEGCSIECMTPTGDDSRSAIWGPSGFKALWESTGGDWAANPWVWVIDFKRLSRTGLPQA